MTTFLTTHNMDEAAALCDRVAIINRGRLAAIDTPQALRERVQSRSCVEVTFEGDGLAEADLGDLEVAAETSALAGGFRIHTGQPGLVAQSVARLATERGVRIASINTLAPTLEDVFLQLTSDRPKEAGAGDEQAG